MNIEHVIPEEYRWENLASREGIELKEHYQRLLLELGSSDNSILRKFMPMQVQAFLSRRT